MFESPEICGCINPENLHDTTGSPGGDTFKSLENINYLLISLVRTLLVLFNFSRVLISTMINYHILRMFTIADFPNKCWIFLQKFPKLPVNHTKFV